MCPYATNFSILSKAEQTILGVLLWQANSKGKKNFSTWTHNGLGSGKTEPWIELDPGDAGPPPEVPPDEFTVWSEGFLLIQICSAGAKNFTKCVFCHPQFSGVVQNIENRCAILTPICLCRLVSK